VNTEKAGVRMPYAHEALKSNDNLSDDDDNRRDFCALSLFAQGVEFR
jgi:hypothetical protein